MIKRTLSRLAATLTGAIALTFVTAAPAFAQPENDDFTNATVVSALPFTTVGDTSAATGDPSDPQGCYNSGSVWYAFTPSTNMSVRADTSGSSYDTVLSAWTGAPGSLAFVACNDDYPGAGSRINFTATAGTTYYFMVARCCGWGGDGGGPLRFSVTQVQPPANDNFADATPVTGLPFAHTADLSTAGAEPGEPTSCVRTNTVWYSFTPSTTGSVTARINQYGHGIAAYTGTSLTSLSRIGCETYYWNNLTFNAQAGTTYFFQVGVTSYSPTSVTFTLNVAPAPSAAFGYYPSEPNTFDTIQFSNQSQDPAGAGFSAWAWEFGDGSTSTDDYTSHQYAADGDYAVRLTVTTVDGRTASTSRIVQVRTHDVSITRLTVPATAHAGQTIGISVYLVNRRYPESVQVSLEKSIPGGYTYVGSLTQQVLVKTGGQTTRFAFSYTITSDDVAAGKITFRASAALPNSRDAFPADNELLSTPVNIV